MRFAFTPDQLLFRDSLRAVLSRECTPAVVRATWSREDGRAPGLWKTLAELGIVGLTAPESSGGLGLSALDLVLLLEECGRAALPEPIVETTAVAVPLLAELGREDALSSVARGDTVIAVGLEAAGEYVTYATLAERLVLQRGDDLHLVPREADTLEAQPSVDGSRRLSRVRWEPSVATLLVGGTEGRAAIDRAFDRGALATASVLLGLARHMLDLTVEYVKVRKQFGSAIGSFQAVKHHLADALLAIEMARPVVARAAYTVSAPAPRDASLHVSMAKACASDAALLTARAALQCHGAIGYSFEHDLHLWMKRAWALAASWGDAAWHRRRVGRLIPRATTSATTTGTMTTSDATTKRGT
jgi:alkylation response protein AidB-like acyl-CoA dehydrogenase